MTKISAFFSSLWQFSRPHTIIGTTLSAIALYFLALANALENFNLNWFLGHLGLFFVAWIACLGGNLYIVGLNQLYDLEIDRINKPQLPLASGEFSVKQGQIIITIAGILAIVLSAISSKWLFTTVALSLLIGTAYSVPPLRLKRFPFLAALCILVVRGAIVNLGLFAYFNSSLELSPILIALTLFIIIFSIAIALFKDVPDTEGDQQFSIKTFSLSLGKTTVFNITRGIITLAYLGMIIAGLLILPINPYFLVGYHSILLILLWWKSWKVNLESKAEIANFYQFIWKLFFLEYLLFPLACFITV
ncbi:MAG: homogentisate phytyltransferase [Microcystaceae cyanobacterium]